MIPVQILKNAFADLHFEEKEIITTEDKVFAQVIMSGQHVKDFMRNYWKLKAIDSFDMSSPNVTTGL